MDGPTKIDLFDNSILLGQVKTSTDKENTSMGWNGKHFEADYQILKSDPG